MRAVNLIPEEGRGGSRRGSLSLGSGGASYALLGGLAVMVGAVGVHSMTKKQIDDRQVKLERVQAETTAAQARAGAAAPFQAFSQLANDRAATVKSLTTTRFDWAVAMREISRVLPSDVYLESLKGASGGSAEAPSPTTSVAPTPSFELVGCTGGQANVARLMGRLRAVDGVRGVNLASSEKSDGQQGQAQGEGGCGKGRAGDAKFTMSIRFDGKSEPISPVAAAAVPGAAPAVPGAVPPTPPAAPAGPATAGTPAPSSPPTAN